MKKYITLALLFIYGIITAQESNAIDWNPEYKLQLTDFKSQGTQLSGANIYSLHNSATIDYSLQMSLFQFMATKNFNSKVSCRFFPKSAAIIAPDKETALSLLNFAQYEFDTSELYARKFRKLLYEEKNTFSNMDYIRPLFENIKKEKIERISHAGKTTNLGRNAEELKKLHEVVLKEIEELSDFCKECKPKKKKKK